MIREEIYYLFSGMITTVKEKTHGSYCLWQPMQRGSEMICAARSSGAFLIWPRPWHVKQSLYPRASCIFLILGFLLWHSLQTASDKDVKTRIRKTIVTTTNRAFIPLFCRCKEQASMIKIICPGMRIAD